MPLLASCPWGGIIDRPGPAPGRPDQPHRRVVPELPRHAADARCGRVGGSHFGEVGRALRAFRPPGPVRPCGECGRASRTTVRGRGCVRLLRKGRPPARTIQSNSAPPAAGCDDRVAVSRSARFRGGALGFQYRGKSRAQSSPENRSQAACLDTPSASPMRVQLMPRPRRVAT